MTRMFPILMRAGDRLGEIRAEVAEAAWTLYTIARFRR